MKKKFLSLLLAICMIIPCAFILNACGGKDKSISKAQWEELLTDCTFKCTVNGDYFCSATKNSYETTEYGTNEYDVWNIEHIRLIEDGQTNYVKVKSPKGNPNRNEVSDLNEEDFIYGGEYFAPIFDFVKNNYSKFKYDANTHRYPVYYAELQVSADAKNTITSLSESNKDSYLFVVSVADLTHVTGSNANMGGKYTIMSLQILDKSYSDYSAQDSGVIDFERFNRYVPEYLVRKVFDDFKNFEVEYKVVGGTGVNYMELYFTKNAMRFYTPNQNDPEGYVDGIFCNDNGSYKYFKKDMNGVWSVTSIDQDTYNQRVTSLYEMFGGGKILDTIKNNLHIYNKYMTGSDVEIHGGKSGLQDIYYYDYSIKFEDGITSGTWKQKYYQAFGDITTDGGAFTMTVCDVTIDIPTV